MDALWVALFAWLVAGYGILAWQSSQQNPTQHYATKNANYEKANGDKQKSWVQLAAGDPIAVFTLFLVLVGGTQVVLFLWQLRLIRRSLIDTKTTADAAKNSAQAIPKVERAYIFVHPVSDNFSLALFADAASRHYSTGSDPQVPTPMVKIRVSNGGKTAASLVEIHIGLIHSISVPEVTGYASFTATQLRLPMIATGTFMEFDPECKNAIQGSDFEMFRNDNRWFFVQGQILYNTSPH